MKSYLKTIVLAAAVIMVASANSFAALNMYLKISGGGTTKIVKLDCPNGACTATVDGLRNGNYTFTLCDAQGTPLAMKAKEKANRTKCSMVVTAREAGSGMATGKAASSSSVTSPRDAATGLATGKRMHKPFTITKELDRTTSTFVAAGDVDGDGSFDVTFTCTIDGKTTAVDDWQVSSN